jgi:hypothetical protein
MSSPIVNLNTSEQRPFLVVANESAQPPDEYVTVNSYVRCS